MLTSGGDASGMNAAIRAVVRSGIYKNMDVYGVHHGYEGLITGQLEKMSRGSVADIIQRGGTILQTSRSEAFKTDEGRQTAKRVLDQLEIEHLVVIGGNGSFKGGYEFSKLGINVIGIPAAGGAESILIPEIENDLEEVIDKINQGNRRGKLHSIILVAEGVYDVMELRQYIEAKTGHDTRVTILGHIQRGGPPTAVDRILASCMGKAAIDMIAAGERNVMVAGKGEQVKSIPLQEVINGTRTPELNMFEIARILSI